MTRRPAQGRSSLCFEPCNNAPGTYKLAVWHERLDKKKVEFTVTAKDKASVELTYP